MKNKKIIETSRILLWIILAGTFAFAQGESVGKYEFFEDGGKTAGEAKSLTIGKNFQPIAPANEKSGKVYFEKTVKQSSEKAAFESNTEFDKTVFQAVKLLPDGRILAAGSLSSADNIGIIWDSGKKNLLTLKGHSEDIKDFVFSPDGRILATGSKDSTVKFWDVDSGKELKTLSGHKDEIFSIAFSPDGKTFASADAEAVFKLWNVESGKELKSFGGLTEIEILTGSEELKPPGFSLTFSPDGKILASGGVKQIDFWETATGKKVNTISKEKSFGFTAIAFSPDGQHLVAGELTENIILWNVESGKEIRTFFSKDSLNIALTFSPDGKTLVTNGADETIKLWNVKSGKQLKSLSGHKTTVASAVFSSDGKTLITASLGTIKFWDVETGKELKSLPKSSSTAGSSQKDDEGFDIRYSR